MAELTGRIVAPAEPVREPERLMLVLRQVEVDGESRVLLVRWPDWPPPALLSIPAPSPPTALDEAVASVLHQRLALRPRAPLRASAERLPVRMRHPRAGGEGTGWLRPVAVDVEGEPRPDSLISEVLALTVEEAAAQLSTDVERRTLAIGAALLEDDG